jgi:eukaryotic-like serine/threonine-protein kinase
MPEAQLDHAVARERVRGALFGSPTAITIDRFTVLERVGEGGMGTVFAAYDPRLDRRIALKLLRTDHDDGTDGSARQARLLREARAMARLSHPNVGAVHDVGLFAASDGAAQVWIAMEFVAGEGLRAWCERARPSAAEIIDAYVQAGRGLAAAHAAGLVHRDFKPDNAMRDESGRVRVLDFGLARTRDDEGESTVPTAQRDELLARMPVETPTRTGALVGTPAYLAPEQIRGQRADAKSDQFAFCVALHEALWGVRPFAGATVAALFEAVVAGVITIPPRRADVPKRVRAAIVRGLSLDPADRWPDIPELLAALERRPTGRAAIAVGCAAAAIGLAIVLARSDACTDSDRALGQEWDDAARDTVREAVRADGRPFAHELSTRVVDALDRYDAELRRGYHEACVATHEAAVQSTELLDRETACLDARAAGFRAAAGLLAAPDRKVIERATQLVDGLAPIDPCLDRAALLAIEAAPDPALAPAIAEVERMLAEAGAQRRAGHFEDARVQAEQALSDAERSGDRATRADASGELALVLRDVGDHERSCELFARAHFLADGNRQDVLAANTASEMIECPPDGEAGRIARELWRANAQAAIDRLRDPDLARARLDTSYAFAMLRAERPGDAVPLFENALALRRGRIDEDAREIWATELELATALVGVGRTDEAIALADDAARRAERALGPGHPHVAAALGNVVNVHFNAGDMVGAEAVGRRALAVAEAAFGRDHRVTTQLLLNLSGAVYMQRRWDEAAELQRDCLARIERDGRADSLDWASTAHNYATALFELDRYDEALPIADRSRAWYEAQLGDNPASMVESYQLLGNIQLERGEQVEAERWMRLAVESAADMGTNPLRIQALDNLANLLRRIDRPLESVQVYQEELALMRAGERPRWELAQTEYDLARSMWGAGDRTGARSLAESVIATLRDVPRSAETEGLFRRDVTPETVEQWLATHEAAD